MEQELTNHQSITSPESLIIRFTTHADLSEIARVARVTWDATYYQTIAAANREAFLNWAYQPENLSWAVDTPGHWFYVAELEKQIIGFAHFLRRYHRRQARAELIRLYVLPEHQNSGIGHHLLQTGFADLAEAGIEQCFVSVQAVNKLARKFYERYGFTFHRRHGQFLGTQIVTLIEYIRPITDTEAKE